MQVGHFYYYYNTALNLHKRILAESPYYGTIVVNLVNQLFIECFLLYEYRDLRVVFG